LAQHIDEWRNITDDRQVLKNISGHHLELSSKPRLVMEPQIKNKEQRTDPKLDKEIQEFLDKKAIERAPNNPGHFSSMFGVPKKDSDRTRPVFNLKPLSRHVKLRKFSMDSITMVMKKMKQGDWAI